ncbi:Ank3, partial [Symbiodinium pilosum]
SMVAPSRMGPMAALSAVLISVLVSQATAFRTEPGAVSAPTRRGKEHQPEGERPVRVGRNTDLETVPWILPGEREGMEPPRPGRWRGSHALDWEQASKEAPNAKEILLAVGGGTGAGTGTGSAAMDRDLIRRMRYQDKLVLCLMIFAYFVALIFTASLAYRQAGNNSPVKFYGDPRVEDLMIDTTEVEDFLHVFSQPPRRVQLCVQGLLPVPTLLTHMADGSTEWQGCFYRHVFCFGLDLSPFIVHADVDEDAPEGQINGVHADEVEILRKFLRENRNDLATVQLAKEVSWDGWEELATNIKHKIRQKGFEGLIHVSWRNTELLTVYKNRTWANFLHRGITRVLLALSIIGYAWYVPYMYVRQRGPEVHPKFKVDIDIQSYWRLIGEKINERGFDPQ